MPKKSDIITPPTIQQVSKTEIVMWQGAHEDYPIPEPALLIDSRSDVIIIQQENRYVNFNYESIDELCKILKKLKADRK
jgi:hypothetical protein